MIDHLIAHLPPDVQENLRHTFEERAGIIEFDGGKTRAEAEQMAAVEIEQRVAAMRM
jgi:hypothetical protein